MQHNLDYITDAIGKVAQDAQLFQLRGNVLMQWNAQVADLKQGLLDIEANIMKLEQERDRKQSEHQQAMERKHDTQQQVIKFTELVREEQHEARRQQELTEDRELEDFRSPETSF